MVECDLAKVEVAGSNPVSRSKRAKVVDPLAAREGLCCTGAWQFVKNQGAAPKLSRFAGVSEAKAEREPAGEIPKRFLRGILEFLVPKIV